MEGVSYSLEGHYWGVNYSLKGHYWGVSYSWEGHSWGVNYSFILHFDQQLVDALLTCLYYHYIDLIQFHYLLILITAIPSN